MGLEDVEGACTLEPSKGSIEAITEASNLLKRTWTLLNDRFETVEEVQRLYDDMVTVEGGLKAIQEFMEAVKGGFEAIYISGLKPVEGEYRILKGS